MSGFNLLHRVKKRMLFRLLTWWMLCSYRYWWSRRKR